MFKMERIGVVMMNMGGPKTTAEVRPFLQNLFSDSDLMQSNSFFIRKILSRFIVKRRWKRVAEQYNSIGGGSPIHKWSQIQGKNMISELNKNTKNIEFKHYVCFRYVKPNAFCTVEKMLADGIEHGIAFSQYPQYSCTTTGSSLTDLWRAVKELDPQEKIKWSIIDRWPVEKLFVEVVAGKIKKALSGFSTPEKAIILFSAHSLPIKTVNRGDGYVEEVHQTVNGVMASLRESGTTNRHITSWQSKVGPLEWQGPQTGDMLKGLGRQGEKSVLVVPIAFTSDHIETLYEIDVEYAKDAEIAGVSDFRRTESFNNSNSFGTALSTIVLKHIAEKRNFSDKYLTQCARCWQVETCRRLVNPAYPLK